LTAVLAATVGATVVLAGRTSQSSAIVSESGEVKLAGLIFVAWGAGSILGGLVYGALPRALSAFLLLLGLAVLTAPVGLAPGPLTLMLTILPAAALCAPVITSTIEAVSRLVPEHVRGEAMGWHSSALQAGAALGAPLAGMAIDASGPAAGFLVVAVVGAVIALAGLGVQRIRRGPANCQMRRASAQLSDEEGISFHAVWPTLRSRS
jgi:predicted MFS family arabinose efflux permease